MRSSLYLAILILAVVAGGAAGLQDDSAQADPGGDPVAEMLSEARAEVREFREGGGTDDDPDSEPPVSNRHSVKNSPYAAPT